MGKMIKPTVSKH